MIARNRTLTTYWIPIFALCGLIVYFVFHTLGLAPLFGQIALMTVIFIGGLPLLFETIKSLTKGKFNVDLIAVTSIFGGLLIGQYLAAAVIVLMMSGGEALEAYALGKATSALQTLMKQRPRTANRWNGTEYLEIAVEAVVIGDQLLVRPGESAPVDGEIIEGSSDFNESLLTGESLPVTKTIGQKVLSGSQNETSPITIKATTIVSESTFAKIMALVEKAHNNKADLQQIADRFGAWFTPITFVFVLVTFLLTHDWIRAYAVLVIATPCPLILATPIAIIAGIGRAASQGIIVKTGSALEGLARARAILFDKTGTLTTGDLTIGSIDIFDSTNTTDRVLSFAAGLEQFSNHVVARSIVEQAKLKQLTIPKATKIVELPGRGLKGKIADQSFLLGNHSLLVEQHITLAHEVSPAKGDIELFLAQNGIHIATFRLADELRKESPAVIQALKRLNFQFIGLLTGDRQSIAEATARELAIANVYAEVTPDQKMTMVEKLIGEAHQKDQTVVMVGDGINDAPALERADVGIAIGRQGGEVSVEAAAIVLLGEGLNRLPQAVTIGKSVLSIASQGIWFGMIMSFIGMFAGALGYLPPVTGAISQEVIDVLVILNALRVLTANRQEQYQGVAELKA